MLLKIHTLCHPAAVTHSHPEAMLRRRAASGWLWITALPHP